MTINEDVISKIIESNLPEQAKEECEQRKTAVINDVARLQAIQSSLGNYVTLVKRSMSSRSSLSNILQETSYLGLSRNASGVSGDALQKTGELIFEAYERTSKVLQNLGFISSISYTVTYQEKDGSGFMRLGNADLQPTDLTFQIHRNNLVIRMKESAIRARIQTRMQENTSLLSQHYAEFTKPFFDAENASKNGWKVNRGVASEAFERHWENKKHNIEQPEGISSSDLESVGDRWLLYLQSSGNDAYYTGPDTIYAQVKNANASIISNANTVLATLSSILKMVSEEIDDATILKRYQQAFRAKQTDHMSISKKLWENIDKDSQALIQQALGAEGKTINITAGRKKVNKT